MLNLFRSRTHVLFVCTENICRSPMAEVLLRHHLRRIGMGSSIEVSSAGTRTSQPGARPDPRARRIAESAGIKLGGLRAQRVTDGEISRSDFIFAMERTHIQDLQRVCHEEHHSKITLLLSHSPGLGYDEVPDPYYRSYGDFEQVFWLLDSAMPRLLDFIASSTRQL